MVNKINLLEAPVKKLLAGLYILDKLPLNAYRRLALKLYSHECDDPFEQALYKGFLISFFLMLICILFYIGGAFKFINLIILIGICLPLGVLLQFEEMKKLEIKRSRSIVTAFSKFASNCAALISVGVNVRSAFVWSTDSLSDGFVKEALMHASDQIALGVSTATVYKNLNQEISHGMVAEYTSILLQIERYGTANGGELLSVSEKAWQQRKNSAHQEAKRLDTVLVFPSMMMFSGIMLMLFAVMLMQF